MAFAINCSPFYGYTVSFSKLCGGSCGSVSLGTCGRHMWRWQLLRLLLDHWLRIKALVLCWLQPIPIFEEGMWGTHQNTLLPAQPGMWDLLPPKSKSKCLQGKCMWFPICHSSQIIFGSAVEAPSLPFSTKACWDVEVCCSYAPTYPTGGLKSSSAPSYPHGQQEQMANPQNSQKIFIFGFWRCSGVGLIIGHIVSSPTCRWQYLMTGEPAETLTVSIFLSMEEGWTLGCPQGSALFIFPLWAERQNLACTL